ncbi:MAG: formylmethanofuran dehydrogenase subunit C [Burkholderiales bacterium]
MSSLTFKLKQATLQRVDCSSLTSDHLQGKEVAEIAKIELPVGNSNVQAGDLFNITGRDVAKIVFAGDCAKLDRIGAAMTHGEITLAGNCGDYVGLGMKGGTIAAKASSGIFTACGMRGGAIRIAGNAGDFLGGGLPGERRGMFGGLVIVHGNVGDRACDQMRRGMILVEGNIGAYACSRMSGGTIAVLGEVGAFAGFAMKRGTLIVKDLPSQLPITFNDCGEHSLSFLTLVLAYWRTLDTRFAKFNIPNNRVRRWMGDVANAGRGEILVTG